MADAELKHFSTEFEATWSRHSSTIAPSGFEMQSLGFGHTGGISVSCEFARSIRVD